MNQEELDREVAKQMISAAHLNFNEKIEVLLNCSTLLNSAAFNRDKKRLTILEYSNIEKYARQVIEDILTS